jgi:hypothetical protein
MNSIKLFESQNIRSVWNEAEEKWYFSVQDVVSILTETVDAKDYIKKIKKRDLQLNNNWGTICPLIQSIPSPKAEPFKLWLAQVGAERIDEIENPELAIQRTRETYKLKGYSDEWIEKRIRSIAIREELTEEWSQRGVKAQKEYAILTAQISKATFGLTPSEYKEVKNLKRENLRDHMTDLELIFSMLGEASTTAIVKTQKPIGFTENKKVAKQGGDVAGNARKELEIKTGEKVVSPTNYKVLEEKKQKRIN